MKDGQLLIPGRATSASAFALSLLAGFVASVAMVLAFAIAYTASLALGRMPVPLLADWFRGLTHNQFIDTASPNLYAATAVFFVGGLIWSLLYGLVFEARLRGPAWERGVKFALIPWLFSLAVFLPIVGGGFLGMGLGAGPLPALGNLILHAIWGATLGIVFGSAESVLDRPAHIAQADDLLAGHLSERGAAKGLLAGLALGLIAGLVGALLVPQVMNPMALVVALALTGAAFGGFYGSLAIE